MPGTPTTGQTNKEADGSQPDQTSVVVVQRDDSAPPAAPNNVPAREITQTDKLNKRLLVSFLNRMNSQSDSQKESSPMSDDEDENNKDDSDSSFE